MIHIDIYWDNIPDNCEALLTDLIKRGLEYVDAPSSVEISISFVDKEEMQALNKEHREVDKVTDVLSFPFTEPEEWSKESVSCHPFVLGDIIICTDVAREQAEEYGHSFERELGFLTVHGLLHLAGYDHMEPEDEEDMRNAQRDILGELK
ncbi:MAG: rRNA maturation RNase YbeY [Defluviitaleaceae bacterium]|nr:rRNA maturation RNase YbeY [Defluviitaleaceae bacterium]